MATDIQQGVFYDTPVQGGEEKVTRQRGLAIDPAVGIDPTPPPPIIQGDPLTVVERNQGPHVRGHFDGSGVFFADHVEDTAQILYSDGGVVGTGEANQPPGLARVTAPLTPTDVPTPRPEGFGEMTAGQQRAAIRAMAEAAGFSVTDAPAVPVVDVVASDSGANDPRDASSGPQVLTQLPQVKKRAIVPVVLPTPKTRRIVAKAAPKGGR